MRGSQKRRTLWIESLETRRLLAADLQVEILAPTHLIPGEKTDFEVRVTNHGPDNALGVELQSAGVDQVLTDIQWERETALKRVWQFDQIDGQSATSIQAPLQAATNGEGIPIGDINGDGWEDLLYANVGDYSMREAGQAWVIYGRANLAGQIGVGELVGKRGFRIANLLASPASAAGGGDVNGDGIADFVLGVPNTPKTDSTDLNSGVTYVIFGRRGGFGPFLDVSKLDGENGFRVYGRNSLHEIDGIHSARAGFAVDNRGDVNGDGFDDVAIGQLGEMMLESPSTVNVIYGGNGTFPSDIQLDEIDGSIGYRVQAEDVKVGQSVTTSGDFNDDGIDDLLFASLSGRAEATVLWGSTEARPATIELTELPPQSYSTFSVRTSTYTGRHPQYENRRVARVLAVQDMNGDQINDFVVATPQSGELGFLWSGQANVIFGNRNGLPSELTPDMLSGENGATLVVDRNQTMLGLYPQDLGDLNGDGLSDITLGSRLGKSWILYGSDGNWSARADLEEMSLQAVSEVQMRRTLSTIGDVNGDGHSDLFVPGSVANGAPKIVLGPFHEQFAAIRQEHPARTSGSGLLGDIINLPAGATATYWITAVTRESAAGVAQWIVSADHSAGGVNNQLDSREAHVAVPVHRNVDLQLNAANVRRREGDDEVEFDLRLRNVGPLPAPAAQLDTGSWEGLEEIRWTRTTTQVAPGYVAGTAASEQAATDRFEIPGRQGRALISVGDVNGDGLDDLAAVGRGLYLYFGQRDRAEDYPQLDGTQAVFFAAKQPFGGVASAGDVNGDGLNDVLAWGPRDRVGYVIYGKREFVSPTMSLAELSVDQGFYLRSDKHFSKSAPIGVGDINHDGFDDLAVRVRRNVEDYPEDIMIFPGGPTTEQGGVSHDIGEVETLGTIQFTKSGVGIIEIQAAGDTNGDGSDDLLLSTTNGSSRSGRLLLLYGNPNGLGQVSIDGEPLPPEVGLFPRIPGYGNLDVSPAGDINGDGLADVMAGFDAQIPTDQPISRWVMVLGSRTEFDPEQHVVAISYWNASYFQKIGAVGDVNFDGVDDVAHHAQRSGDRAVLFGAHDIHHLHDRATLHRNALFRSLTPEQVRFTDSLRAIGDFNGDGIHDYVVGDQIVITPTISTVAVGKGTPDMRLNLAPYSQVLWELHARVREDSPSELPTVTATAHAGAARSDSNLADNAVQILYDEAGHGEATRFDLNDDQIIDAADLAILARYYGTAVTEPGRGDLDEDGRVDFGDFLLFWQRFATN